MSKPKKMSPDEFAAKMRKIDENYDTEGAHADADDLMCELLESLGYAEGVKIFRDMDKWYA